jgi:predicted O-linked N-acetylglucosamine transferase (SPINDLY family)
LAVELATDGRGLAAIRHKLAENRLTTPLFDTQRFTKHLEAAYLGIYDRHQANLPVAHITVRSSL